MKRTLSPIPHIRCKNYSNLLLYNKIEVHQEIENEHIKRERLNIRFNRKIKLEFHGEDLHLMGIRLPTGRLMRH
jgi:hypothetical protein